MAIIKAHFWRGTLPILIGLVLGISLFRHVRREGEHDFLPFYMGAQLAASGHVAQIYDKPAYQPLIANLRSQGVRLSGFDAHYFIRPSFEAFLYIPFTWFRYERAATMMLLGNLALLAVLIWKLPIWFSIAPHLRLAVRCGLAIFYPFLWSILVGQDMLLFTLLIAYALFLESRGKRVTAGILMGVCAWKPHLMWLMPLVCLAAHRWKMAIACAATLSGLMLMSFLPVGLAGFHQWLELVRAPSSDITPAVMGNLRALGVHFGSPVAAIALSWTLICFLVVLTGGAFYEKVTAGLIAGLLVSPHTYLQDYSLMALVAMMTTNRWVRVILLLPWPFLYPRTDQIPMIFIALTVLTTLAGNCVLQRWPAFRAHAAAAWIH